MAANKKVSYRSSYMLFFPLVFVMMILEIMRLPAIIAAYRPDFTGMLLIFFAVADPRRINVGAAWLTGLAVDLLTGAPLGINGLVLALQVYIIVAHFKTFSTFLIWQQMLVIGLVNFLSNVCVNWFGHLIGQGSYGTNFAWKTLITILTWPLMCILFRMLWDRLRISSFTTRSEQEL